VITSRRQHDARATDSGNHGDDVNNPSRCLSHGNFYGTTYTQVTLCSNGHLTFVASAASNQYQNGCLPSSRVLGRDHDAALGRSRPTGPDRASHLDYRHGPPDFETSSGARLFQHTAQTANFEIVFTKSLTRFDFIYATIDQGGSGATVARRNASGTAFVQYLCNTTGTRPPRPEF